MTVLAVKPDDLSLIPKIHIVENKTTNSQASSPFTSNGCQVVGITHTQKHKDRGKKMGERE